MIAVCLASGFALGPPVTVSPSEPALGRRFRAGRARTCDGPLERDDRVGEAAEEDERAITSEGSGTGTPEREGTDVAGREGSSSESDSSSHFPLDFGVTFRLAAAYAAAVADFDSRERYTMPKMQRIHALKTIGWLEKRVMPSKRGRTVSK